MKRSTKIWLAVGACLILIGVLSFGFAMAANRWEFTALGTSELVTAAYDIEEDFRDIEIRSDTEDITFLPSADGKCRVVFHEWEQEKHTASVKGGTLSIGKVDTRKWYDHISFFSFGSPTITIYLTGAAYASLTIEESTGDIEIPAEFTFESMRVSLSTGDVACSASSSGPIRIEASTGDIRVENASAGELDLSVSTGRVDVHSVACAGGVSVTVSTGKTLCADVECGSLASNGDTGDITLQNVIARDAITIERSTGDVRFEACDAGELSVRTDTGDVEGSLLSEKIFIAQSDTGHIEVPETTAGGICRITTDTGDIRISLH